MSSGRRYAIGIDIGGTDVKGVVVTLEGKYIQNWFYPTEFNAAHPPYANSLQDRVYHSIGSVCSRRKSKPAAIGICAPGLAAPDGDSIAWMQGRLEEIQGLKWANAFRRRLDRGQSPFIPVINDAHAALLGEVWQGAAQGMQNVVMLTLGTGVGGAAMVDGHLLRGHIGRAGHLGHISLNPDGPLDIVNTPGSLEDAIGECTLQQRTGGRFTSTLELIKACREGDNGAEETWSRSLRALGAGIVSLVNVLDPEVVVLGGGIAEAGDSLFVPLQSLLDRWEWRPTGSSVRLIPAKLSTWAGAYGAAFHALNGRKQTGVTQCI